jgi:hypothetical protein
MQDLPERSLKDQANVVESFTGELTSRRGKLLQ